MQYVLDQRQDPSSSFSFRMEVATILLAQHHGARCRPFDTVRGRRDSNQGVKRHVTELPHVSVRGGANAHLPEMIGLKNAMRCRQLGCTGRTRVRCMTCKVFLCLQNRAQLLLSLSHISDGSDSQVVYMFLGSSMFSDSVKVNQSGDLWASVSRPGPSVLSCRSLFYITNAKCHMSYWFFFFHYDVQNTLVA